MMSHLCNRRVREFLITVHTPVESIVN
jgi:hypothetical protein